MNKGTTVLVAGMLFWGVVVGLGLHATGAFFTQPSLIKNVVSTILVSVFYTLAMISLFKPKIEPGREMKAFFLPVPAFVVLAAWAGILSVLR